MNEVSSPSLYYPNRLGRAFLMALQETLMRNGYHALLNWAELPRYAEYSAIEKNWAREFEFAHISRLCEGLNVVYGPRGGRQLALRAGQRFFERGLETFGVVAGVSDIALRAMPLQTKLKMGLKGLARIFNQTSDQPTWLEEQTLHFYYHVDACPICWERSASQPICYFTVGFLQAAVRWIGSGLDFRVQQTACLAAGDEGCVFQITREPIR